MALKLNTIPAVPAGRPYLRAILPPLRHCLRGSERQDSSLLYCCIAPKKPLTPENEGFRFSLQYERGSWNR